MPLTSYHNDAVMLAVRAGLHFCTDHTSGRAVLYAMGLGVHQHHDVEGCTPERVNRIKNRIVQEVANTFRRAAGEKAEPLVL